VQREIRYVAIEIGIGGYQPHASNEVFADRYGDCKDKAALLSVMLNEIRVPTYLVLVHTDRGAVASQFPSMANFNHVIVAIRTPDTKEHAGLPAIRQHEGLGTLLFFDPTDTTTALGYLPGCQQGGLGLLVSGNEGGLVELPVAPPESNRLDRVGKFTLSPAGVLSGEVQEIRSGAYASERRAQLLDLPTAERPNIIEAFLNRFLSRFRLGNTKVSGLESGNAPLVQSYGIVAEKYAQITGDLLLLRLRVLGQRGFSLEQERMYPVELGLASIESDTYEIAVPSGYMADELPPPLRLENSFADYSSQVEFSGTVIRYSRAYRVKSLTVPIESMAVLKQFFKQIAEDERASAVFKRAQP
jgi:hypothetical protein